MVVALKGWSWSQFDAIVLEYPISRIISFFLSVSWDNLETEIGLHSILKWRKVENIGWKISKDN